MNLKIKGFYSFELEDYLDRYRPIERDNFGTTIRLSIGPADEKGADDFLLFVCTPQWLSEELERDSPARWARHFLIVKEYDLDLITDQCERLVRRCCGNDWLTIAQKIARYAYWEFEDIQP
ncbi:immunity 8 family protein [Paraburkholderia sp. RL17-337-BIB-A]|uniref:immunity 8 family protein n=1 Tax=Paraburkholderia sp. RL17-337-BIB-A TaxID=3031636 RepID=UPI0038BB68D6